MKLLSASGVLYPSHIIILSSARQKLVNDSIASMTYTTMTGDAYRQLMGPFWPSWKCAIIICHDSSQSTLNHDYKVIIKAPKLKQEKVAKLD